MQRQEQQRRKSTDFTAGGCYGRKVLGRFFWFLGGLHVLAQRLTFAMAAVSAVDVPAFPSLLFCSAAKTLKAAWASSTVAGMTSANCTALP